MYASICVSYEHVKSPYYTPIPPPPPPHPLAAALSLTFCAPWKVTTIQQSKRL